MSNEPKWKFTTRDEIEEVRSALKIYFPNKSSDRAAFNTVCDIALKALDPAWCRRCGVFHDAELGETCPKKLQPEARYSEKPVAWLIVRHSGTGGQSARHLELVLSPLTDDTHMDEGDEAWPLHSRLPQRDAQGEQK